ncbi:MAG TPA: alpha/beta hydrolase [Gemmatimonadaceae bacterium]|nr:alpha/beta hydrolase [Gemmatimonadaceae bacterium]
MHVARFGHGGPPIILIHGFATCSFLWRNVGPMLAEAACTAYAVDLFGYGESDRPFDADFSIAAQAEYLDAAMTALRVARATLVGVDLGGGVAMRVAATRPERVERLVLINSIGLDAFPGDDIRLLNRNTAKFVLRVRRGVMGAAPLLTPILEGSVLSPEHMPPRLVARYLAPYVGQDGVNHLLLLARSIDSDDLEDLDLRAIQAPTLILWGEEDRWLDDRLPDRLANAIPGARLVRIPGIARLLPEENPERAAEEIIDFLREREP